MKKALIVLLILALLAGLGVFLYKHFVTDRVMDWGGMENPDLRRAEAKLPASDAEELSLREDITN